MIKRLNFLEISLVALFVLSLSLMLLPLSPLVLDIGLMFSITASLFILFVTIHSEDFSQFSVFPTLLLLTTFFRLCLNVASTRMILTEGHEGAGSVSSIITSFGSLVAGNSLVIGFVIFLTLVLVNFVVITKGSERVAEVVARFTLDALPGKQLSIESDVKSRRITEKEAQKKRDRLERESDFYGAMDGASKFVRGDAIASLCIMALNLLGGVVIGVFQKDLSFLQASQYYTMLTIGDGLVHQIPALLVSISAGMMITGTRRSQNIFKTIGLELFEPKVIYSVSAILLIMALIPGFPNILFVVMALGLFVFAQQRHYMMKKDLENQTPQISSRAIETPLRPMLESQASEHDSHFLKTTYLEIEFSYDWVSSISAFTEELSRVRQELSYELGYRVPFVRLKDNLNLKPGEVRLLFKGRPIYSERMPIRRLLAVTSENLENIEALAYDEKILGLPSFWIRKVDRASVLNRGGQVFTPSKVLAHHLKAVLKMNAHLLLTRWEAKKWLERVKQSHEELCDELFSEKLSLAQLYEVLKAVLEESQSIADAFFILEILLEEVEASSSQERLILNVRKKVKQNVMGSLKDENQKI